MQHFASNTINGLYSITPASSYDFRGQTIETFSKNQYANLLPNQVEFVEDDVSVSRQNTLRGLHGDEKTWKLVQCLYGAIYLVVVDYRPDSSSFLQSETFALNDKNRTQILIPAGCANGHLCLSETCVFSYKQSAYYTGAAKQFTLRWNDPKLNIFWPIQNPILSYRDSFAALLP